MYYEDQERRFNFVTGLLFGSLLGAGFALLVSPRRIRAAARGSLPGRRRPANRLARVGESALGSFNDALAAGRKRLRG